MSTKGKFTENRNLSVFQRGYISLFAPVYNTRCTIEILYMVHATYKFQRLGALTHISPNAGLSFDNNNKNGMGCDEIFDFIQCEFDFF